MPEFRKKEWVNGNRMKIDTGCKTFDRQISAIGTGQVLGSTQTSWCVRPYSETECNGHQFEKGSLRATDLRGFGNIPAPVRRWLDENRETACILYKFFHCRSGGVEKTVHGFVITGRDYKLLYRWDNGRYKSMRVIDECLTYITPLPEMAAAAVS